MTTDRLSAWAPHALALLRIVVALLFIEHGTQKLFGFPVSSMQMPPLEGLMAVLMPISGVLELVGGLAILVGAFTRIVAFVLSGEMAVAYFIGHAPMNFFPVNNFGDAAILFCFVFLYLVFAGPGSLSADAARARR